MNNTLLHYTIKFQDFNFFGIRHSFRGLKPLKLKNFDKKIKIFTSTQILAQCSSGERMNNTSLDYAIKFQDFNFFGIRHSFRGLTPLKLKNFDKKFKIFTNTQILAQRSF